MKGRVLLIFSAMLALMLLVSACGAAPSTYFDAEDEIDILHITLYIRAEGSDITEEVDMEAFIDMLREMECRKGSKFDSYSLNDVRYEIDGMYGSEPFHIVLGEGKLNFIYSTSEKGSCAIVDPAALKAFLDNR